MPKSGGPRSVVIHGHFYQPPREDPWLDEVPEQPSAAPFHDWNRRIERECYRAVAAARIPGPDGRIARIRNTLASISFNFGPTLLRWLEREAPATYEAVVEADRLSRVRFRGHGNALAMPYHHTILPLSPRRDRVTEVRWGIADFRRRFGRDPAGMWLPETAVDLETLDVLAAEGIAFTVLAPYQVTPLPAHGLPGLVRTSRGRSIAVFPYDGDISHDVAFGALLKDASFWAERMAARPVPHPGTELVSVAVDGETFGHHHAFGEMALAAALEELEGRPAVTVENFASFLAQHEPREEVRVVEPTAWSCSHGVDRWRADCGCKIAPHIPSQQAWRRPLREAMHWLADRLHERFEEDARGLLADPWRARDAYGSVMDRPDEIPSFLLRFAGRRLSEEETVRARELLEMERDALRIFTSCGWFFDDVADIGTVQLLRYAARGIALAGGDLGEAFAERLQSARSNDFDAGDGARIYRRRVREKHVPALRVAAGWGAARAVDPSAPPAVAGFRAWREGGLTLVEDRATGRIHRFRVEVRRPAAGRLEVSATEEGEAAVEVSLGDLPGVFRKAVLRGLREAVADRWLAPEERHELALGRSGLDEIAPAALLRAVSALADDRTETALRRVLDLADLLELLDRTIPFDAQTEFWRIRRRLGSEASAALAPLAEALGFADGESG